MLGRRGVGETVSMALVLQCRRLAALASGVLAVEAACKALIGLGGGGEDLQGGPPESALLRAASAAALDPTSAPMQTVQAVREAMDWPSTSTASKVCNRAPDSGLDQELQLMCMPIWSISSSSMGWPCPASQTTKVDLAHRLPANRTIWSWNICRTTY